MMPLFQAPKRQSARELVQRRERRKGRAQMWRRRMSAVRGLGRTLPCRRNMPQQVLYYELCYELYYWFYYELYYWLYYELYGFTTGFTTSFTTRGLGRTLLCRRGKPEQVLWRRRGQRRRAHTYVGLLRMQMCAYVCRCCGGGEGRGGGRVRTSVC